MLVNGDRRRWLWTVIYRRTECSSPFRADRRSKERNVFVKRCYVRSEPFRVKPRTETKDRLSEVTGIKKMPGLIIQSQEEMIGTRKGNPRGTEFIRE